MNDPFNALDVLRVGEETYRYYRLDALEKAGLTVSGSASLFHPHRPRSRPAAMQRARDHGRRCPAHRGLDAARRSPRHSFPSGPRHHAGLHRRPRGRGPRRHALRRRPPGRRSRDASIRSCPSISSSTTRFRWISSPRRMPCSATRRSNSSATASATNSSSGARRPSTTSASCRP